MKNLFLLFISFLLFCSCRKSSDTPTPQDESVYSTDFSVDDRTWFTDANHILNLSPDFSFTIKASGENYQFWGIAPFSTINYNYSISADAKLFLGSTDKYGSVGLILNYIDNTHYTVCYITNGGTFFAYKNEGGAFTTLLNTTSSSIIKTQTGATNHIEVRQYDVTARLLINGVSVGTFTVARGTAFLRAGIATSTFSAPYYTTVTGEFDNVIIKKIYN